MRELIVQDLGITDYGDVYTLQKTLVERKKSDVSHADYLLLTEHRDVYTYGRKSKSTPVGGFHVERGGEATFHNPGQLVVYPILYLEDGHRDMLAYLRKLERVLIEMFLSFGLRTEAVAGATGIWMKGKPKKIASIGVAAASWVTYHGCAVNVDNDLQGFGSILPCGFTADVMTNLKTELAHDCPSVAQVKFALLKAFRLWFPLRGPGLQAASAG